MKRKFYFDNEEVAWKNCCAFRVRMYKPVFRSI